MSGFPMTDARIMEQRVRREAVQAQNRTLEMVRSLSLTIERGTLSEISRREMLEGLDSIKRMVGEIPFVPKRTGENNPPV